VLLKTSATVFRSTDAEDKHGKGKNDKDKLDMLAIDFSNGHGEKSKFVFHVEHPFVVGTICCRNNTFPQASKQASKTKQKRPLSRPFLLTDAAHLTAIPGVEGYSPEI
jgi:hypothetical protein